MNEQRSIGEILEVIGKTLRSVDIRTAAVRDNHQWLSLLTFVRFSCDDLQTALNRQDELRRLQGVIKTKDFQIAHSSIAIDEWPAFASECNRGNLHLGNDQFNLLQQVNVNGQLGRFMRYIHELRQEGARWPGFEIYFGDYRPEKLRTDQIARQVAGLGWESPFEAISALCGVEVTEGVTKIYNFYVYIPFFGVISDVRILTPKNILALSIDKHEALPSLTTIATIKEQTNAIVQHKVSRTLINLNATDHVAGEIRRYKGEFALDAIRPDRIVDIKLVHPILAEVGAQQDSMRNLIPVAERNVLWEAFRHFCPEADLEAMLAHPHEHKGKRTKPDIAFELHVSWLLGLFGFSTIILGEYEKLFAKTTRVERGSVDILAAKQQSNFLMLVACTIGPPKEVDFTNLAHMVNVLRRDFFTNTRVAIQPILFTGVTTLHGPYKEIDGGLGQIPIVDVDGLHTLLELVRTGREKIFWNFLTNPTFYRLEIP